MKKNIPLITFLLCSVIGWAQIPTGYYSTATGTGLTLKTNLRKIIDNVSDGISSEHLHSDQGYPALWTLYTHTAFRDNYYENDGSLLDMYSENPSGPDPYNFTLVTNQCGSYSGEGDCYNREHLVPQSYFDHFAVNPMKNDPFFVVPSDGKVNGDRNNLPFGKVGTATYTSQNGSKRGNGLNSGYALGYSGVVFEPIDEFKGDIARMLLYFATRYEDQVASWSYTMFNGTSTQVFTNQALNVLLTWNAQDPVSQREIDRNNAVYARQNNRNPYIDNNNYVTQVWGLPLSNPTFSDLNSVAVYPNPTTDIINIQSEVTLEEIEIITINGQVLQQIKQPVLNDNTYTISNLPKGFYFIKLVNASQSVTKKVLVN